MFSIHAMTQECHDLKLPIPSVHVPPPLLRSVRGEIPVCLAAPRGYGQNYRQAAWARSGDGRGRPRDRPAVDLLVAVDHVRHVEAVEDALAAGLGVEGVDPLDGRGEFLGPGADYAGGAVDPQL